MLVTPIALVSKASSLWEAVGLISLAAAAHQGWSANMFTLASDMFPRGAIGSVVGIAGMSGAIGGMLIATAVGLLLQLTGSYVSVFLMAASSYLFALLFIHLLAPTAGAGESRVGAAVLSDTLYRIPRRHRPLADSGPWPRPLARVDQPPAAARRGPVRRVSKPGRRDGDRAAGGRRRLGGRRAGTGPSRARACSPSAPRRCICRRAPSSARRRPRGWRRF